ncbi:MAG TPA: type VI secretion system-associated FHA domain protein TagH [Burkholderiaceae bacterium]|nr:type VI secretion system-associated FHA domain protein TagH [Burkholderiaceae bacterium]
MIALRLVKRPDGSVPALPPQALDANGVTIGRSPQCGLVLADPLRGVSRKHAWIGVQRGGGTALLRCISTTTPLAVNGQQLDPGGEQLVKPGDRLRIGGFELQLEDPELTTIPLPVARAPMAPPPAMSSPTAMQTLMPTGAAVPLRQSRLDALWDVDTAPDPLGSESPLPQSIGAAPLVAGRTRALPPDPIATVVAPTATFAVPEASALPGPSSAHAAEAPASDLDALRLAFLRGAGLPDTLPRGTLEINAEWMAHLGALLRAAAEGTLALLNSRAVAKRSIRAEGTRITAQENNPLKFAPDGAEALALLLRLHSARGFLDPVDALNDAHDDLQVHQLAMVAGMRAAVFELVSRLGPNALEAAEAQPGGLRKLFRNARDAALWRRHREQHARLLEHFDDDFEAVFGREFVRAYEEQARLAAAQRNRP